MGKKITDNVTWVGKVDWDLVHFHGDELSTFHGSSYNAYLIKDEKNVLIDTVWRPYDREFVKRLKEVIDLKDIDYIVMNHNEIDHSGALPELLREIPDTPIYCTKKGEAILRGHYHQDWNYVNVKTGDTLNIGKHTLTFIEAPMLHWPDSMVPYCPEEKILFSNDAFGQHLASGSRFDDENYLSVLYYEAKKYYANILTLYGRQAQAALKALQGLDIEMIATGHGIIWRSHVKEIHDLYEKWSHGVLEKRAVVVFDTMWHSTEQMARTITEAFQEKGIPATFYDIKENPLSDILTDILTSEYLAVGSPTINNQMMPTIASFLCYLKGLTAKGHKAFAFGSYGWGGQSIGLVEEELKAAGCDIVLDKQRLLNTPDENTLEALREAVHTII